MGKRIFTCVAKKKDKKKIIIIKMMMIKWATSLLNLKISFVLRMFPGRRLYSFAPRKAKER